VCGQKYKVPKLTKDGYLSISDNSTFIILIVGNLRSDETSYEEDRWVDMDCVS
jgi:hypothetical protein